MTHNPIRRPSPPAPLGLLKAAAAALLALQAAGCGVLIGNVKPITEKSESYSVLDLSKTDKDWEAVESDREEADEQEEQELNTSDRAYQSSRTGAVIMLNSACRPRHATAPQDLRKLTDLLILGTESIRARAEEEIKVDGVPALQTTLTGRLNGESVKMRTVVLRKGECVYDMMYVSRPDSFPDRIESFERFRSSFRFR